MEPIHLQVSVTLDEEGAKTLVKLIRCAITSEAECTSHTDVQVNGAALAGNHPQVGNGFLIDSKQMSQLLRVSRTTVYEMRTQGKLPKPIQLGRAVRWSYEEIKRWVDAGCPQNRPKTWSFPNSPEVKPIPDNYWRSVILIVRKMVALDITKQFCLF